MMMMTVMMMMNDDDGDDVDDDVERYGRMGGRGRGRLAARRDVQGQMVRNF